MKLNETQRYWAKVVVKERDGSRNAARLLDDHRGACPDEIIEWRNLSMDLDIRVDSDKHKRLSELTRKYETDEVLRTEIW